MSQEVVVRLRDDFDKQLGDDIAERQICWGKEDLVLDLSDANYELLQQDYAKACEVMDRWVKIARKAKSTKRHREAKPDEKQGIRELASQHGLNWHNDNVRKRVREWAVENGHTITGKRVPRGVLEAYIAANP